VRTANFYLVVLLLCLAFSGCGKKAQPQPDHPRLTSKVTLQDVTFHSSSLDRDMQYRVILPAAFDKTKKLRVVYLLHGNGENLRSWSNYSDVARFAERGLSLVMPEGDESYYLNAATRPKDRYEDYIASDLIRDVESRFPAASDRWHRAIVGVSMGGFGAVTLSLKHPDLFVFAAGLSSAIDVPSRPFSWQRIGQYRGHAAIFGPWGSDTRRNNDPFVLARKVYPSAMPYLYLTCGEQEGLLPSNRKFSALLAQRHFQYEFHTGPGNHDWNQWNRVLPGVFASLVEHSNH
jgi:S-formylglutathione hydrolase FrmB